MKHFKQFLAENANRLDVLKEKFKQQLMTLNHIRKPQDYDLLFNKIVAADPSRNKQYLQWMLNLIVKKNIQLSDLGKVHSDLTIFERVKPRLPGDKRDIGRYKAYQDLYDVIKVYENKSVESDDRKNEIAKFGKAITKVYDGSEGNVYIPHSKEASCYLGRGTRWCTAAVSSDNYFDSYNRTGDLYVFTTRKGEKYQMHVARGRAITKQLYDQVESPDSEFFKAVTRNVEFMDSVDRPLRPDHPFFKDPLFVKLMLNDQRVSDFALIYAMRTGNVDIFNKVAPRYKQLLDQMKEDAIEILPDADAGLLRRWQNVVDMLRFIVKNWR